MAQTRHQRAGAAAEQRACTHLEAAGLRIVARNWRCKAGELDIVAREHGAGAETLVFVEVRQRASAAFGGARASISPAKQARLIRAAQLYCQVMRCTEMNCRFDAVLLEGGELEWIRNAFGLDG